MTRIVSQTHPENIAKPLAIANGGTGAKTAQLALQNLSAISANSVGQPNGPVPLDANTLIPLQYLPNSLFTDNNNPAIAGPSKLYIGSVRRFWISDYDINHTYDVTVSKGTVTVNHDIIEITLPYDELLVGQACILTVNGRQISVPIFASFIFESFPVHHYVLSFSSVTFWGIYQLVGGYPDPSNNSPRLHIEFYSDAARTILKVQEDITNISFSPYLACEFDNIIHNLSGYGNTVFYYRMRLEIIDASPEPGVIMSSPWHLGTFELNVAPLN